MGAPLRRKSVLAAMGVLLLASACSSVTRVSTATGQRTGTTGRTAGSTGGPGDLASGVAGEGAGSLTGGAGGGATAVGSGPGADGTAAGAGSCGRAAVKIGVSYSSDLATGLAIVGHPDAAANAANYGATIQQGYQVAVDDLNQRGGLHGCQVELAFHDFKSLAADGFDGQSQQECQDFAQDQKVDVVFTNALENQVLVECLDQAGIPVNNMYFSADRPDFERYASTLLGQDALTVSRFGPFIDAWAAAGYFDPGSKVGLLVGDDGSGSRKRLAEQIWAPDLRARGLDPVIFNYRDINGYNDVSRVTSLFSQAVLQFKAAQVNHVIFPPDQSNGVIFFTQVADSQGYHPRYGITSESGARSWYSVAASQRSRAVAVSYRINDVELDQSLVDQNPATPSRARCIQMYQPQNLVPDYRWCDFLDFLQGALVNEDFSRDALQRGIEALGTSHQSGLGYGATRFAADAHDGLTQIRTMLWDDSANQWSYVSPPTDIA